ncbi:hypothetical protein GCM10009304_03650 [Pseudomonas matsuisoli]|uniref:Uncharacterized protein n=1 Tax=Pseudomonas matsuisoli TaxID=1515666 RepID=A0A917PJH5_9PSED|nr:hypothetical protein GCM10009304_03650 [Pseudomonas matsuisoli]
MRDTVFLAYYSSHLDPVAQCLSPDHAFAMVLHLNVAANFKGAPNGGEWVIAVAAVNSRMLRETDIQRT